MTRCDPRGPLMINVTKMYPRPDASGFDSFGRVFSGTVKVGDKVSVLREGNKHLKRLLQNDFVENSLI